MDRAELRDGAAGIVEATDVLSMPVTTRAVGGGVGGWVGKMLSLGSVYLVHLLPRFPSSSSFPRCVRPSRV